MTYYFCAWMIIACIFTLTLQDIVYLQGFGDDHELFWISGDTMSYILIGTNVAIVLQILFSSDAKRRKTDALTLATLFNQMIVAEVRRGPSHSLAYARTRSLARSIAHSYAPSLQTSDKSQMDNAWNNYLNNAAPGAELELFARMKELAKKVEGAIVSQMASLNQLADLMKLSKRYSAKVHRVFKVGEGV